MALSELTVSVIEPHMLDDLITSFAPRLEHVGWIDPRHGLLGLGVVTNPQYARPVYAFVGDGLKWLHEDGTECVAGHWADGSCTEGGGPIHRG